MLVLKRKKGQEIIIGDNIRIVVNKIDSDSVELAIDAPREISILREEIYTQVALENNSASERDPLAWMRRADDKG